MDFKKYLRFYKYHYAAFFRSKGSLLAAKNSEIFIHKSAKINIANQFFFGEKWTPKDPFPSLLALREDSNLIVYDDFQIYSGSRVYVNKNATLQLGSGYINNNLNLSCFERIEIGDDVAISENVTIRDSDNHYVNGSQKPKTKPIKIGNHVWIGLNVTILKGVEIGEGSIIAAGAVVNRSIPPNCLAAGVPAKIIKNNVEWN